MEKSFGILIDNSHNSRVLEHWLLNFYIQKGYQSHQIALFSETVLQQEINEEFRFGQSKFNLNNGQSIMTFSSGEQKKAIINQLFNQNPIVFIVVGIYDHFDVDFQKKVEEKLLALSQKAIIIQIETRRKNILPWLESTLQWNGKELQSMVNEISTLEQKITKNWPEQVQTIDYEGDVLVDFKNIRIQYGAKTILKNINWQINQGEFWQLVGPNGSGKSTLLSLIIGDNPKAYGQDITLFGHKKGQGISVAEQKQKIGYFNPAITQNFERTSTVLHMVVSGIFDSIGLYKIPTERQIRIAKEWLRFMDLEHLANKNFFKLDVGAQRFVMILRAIIKQPPLLILDEPLAGLDDTHAAKLIHLINQIVIQKTTTVLLVSHRAEQGLVPHRILELVVTESGSKAIFKDSL